MEVRTVASTTKVAVVEPCQHENEKVTSPSTSSLLGLRYSVAISGHKWYLVHLISEFLISSRSDNCEAISIIYFGWPTTSVHAIGVYLWCTLSGYILPLILFKTGLIIQRNYFPCKTFPDNHGSHLVRSHLRVFLLWWPLRAVPA